MSLAGALWLRADRLVARLEEFIDRRGRELERDFELLRGRWYAAFWPAVAASMEARCEEVGSGFLRISRDGTELYVRRYQVMLDNPIALQLAGDKPVCAQLLRRGGIEALPESIDFHPADWRELLPELARGPLVIKPATDTGGGRAVVSQVRNERRLRQAVRHAARTSHRLMAERQIEGHSYRLLYLRGELIDAVRRDPPCVSGDGRRNIAALIDAENRERVGGAHTTALSPLRVDLDARYWLADQGRSLAQVPDKGERVQIKHVCNQNRAIENVDVTAQVCEAVRQQCAAAVAVLGVELAGVDLIAPRVDVALDESAGVINEINTTPGLHHHYLVDGRSPPGGVAEKILADLFVRRA